MIVKIYGNGVVSGFYKTDDIRLTRKGKIEVIDRLITYLEKTAGFNGHVSSGIRANLYNSSFERINLKGLEKLEITQNIFIEKI